MRLLVDENVPLESVRALRAAGHDVYQVAESALGEADDVLLERATAEGRAVMTFDRDFGEFVARENRSADAGVVLLRIVPHSASEVSELLVALLSRDDIEFARRLTVIDRKHLRQRRL